MDDLTALSDRLDAIEARIRGISDASVGPAGDLDELARRRMVLLAADGDRVLIGLGDGPYADVCSRAELRQVIAREAARRRAGSAS